MLSSCISLQVKSIQNSNFKLYQSCNFVDTRSICCVCFLGFFFCIVLVSLKVIQGHNLPDLTRHDPFNNVTLYLDSIPPFPSNKKKMEEDLYNLEDFLCGLQITSLVYVAQPSDRSKLRYLCTISHYNAPTVLSLQLIKPHQTINVICRLIIYQH